MQKKEHTPEKSSSNWEASLKKEQRSEMMKKVALWGGVIIACIAGLAILVQLANKQGPTAEPVVKENLKAVSANDIVLGNPQAKIVVYEYADFQCPACASYNPIINQLLSEYDGKVKVVYRFFPLTGIHQNALISGQAGYAAWKLGKFKEMKDLLFSKQKDWEELKDPTEVFTSYAQIAGMDEAKFLEIMNSDEAKNAVKAGETEAISLGLNSTPSFFVGNKQIAPNGLAGFKTLIDSELGSAGSSSNTEITAKPTTKPLR